MTSYAIQSRLQAEAPLSWINIGFFGVFHALALLAPFFFSWQAVGVVVLLHWLFGGIGICLGYHRLLSHRSFRVPKLLEYAIALCGACALQGGPIFWVSGHRQHHAKTEDPVLDPYSAQKGFWWSHWLWLFRPTEQSFNPRHYQTKTPDLTRQWFYRVLDRYYLLLQVPLAIALYCLGGWSFVIYGIFVRSVVLWHTTWLVNSATHRWGYQTFSADDNARNLWWVALLTYGEGWHNNHHSYPNVAQTGYRWWEVDMTWLTIKALAKLGLARKVKAMPTRSA